uniref:Uncharacterized protein n=1 Tax=Poecilia reticulata TaxID=8081 RepID=A0A3P9PBA5_POERE
MAGKVEQFNKQKLKKTNTEEKNRLPTKEGSPSIHPSIHPFSYTLVPQWSREGCWCPSPASVQGERRGHPGQDASLSQGNTETHRTHNHAHAHT